ncbi:hypothetical protein [Bradyrhizobium genomosp. III]|uniref:hypothetical protein n=1 Tax=Bradyrhizobium genomosp. III TaxID=2683271 RepID=UPI0004B221A8|nr:hypothetical protein [Bradyrhizobium sp. CCBAU 15615]
MSIEQPGKKQRKRKLKRDLVRKLRVSQFKPARMLEPENFQHFDPWLTSDRRVVHVLAQNVAASYEIIFPRKRKMKAEDQKNLEVICRTLLSNFAFLIARGVSAPAITVSLRTPKRKLSRYDRRGFAMLPRLLEALSERGSMVELQKSNQRGIASSCTLHTGLLADMKRFQWRQGDFHWDSGAETIVLSITKRDFARKQKTIELIDYEETPEATALRAEMSHLNRALREAQFTFVDDGGPPVITAHRDLIRHFKIREGEKPRFELGGRIFNGWWQAIPSHRRHAIRINRQPIVDLDISSAFLRLAYIEAGLSPPEGDLYSRVQRLDAASHRDGIKRIISAMLFRETPLTRIPSDIGAQLPRGVTGSEVRAAILSAFPEIADIFETGIGLRLMFTESQIMMRILSGLIDIGIPAMPMHDGIMVQRSAQEVAVKTMTEAAADITGHRLPITLKNIS